ncbi:uncharacterized protein BBOV_IV000680 [Babesia bovis T2Bo]|uniref:Uncharacterized protein n=1 Tax=Babesia bovis TaxID=5865 RepID=A7AV40_BABBO|nr:uncharacterized protein BBOV_IV000680 [Babesia bovis T2Bo]EDO05666.1 hypothetical protein BBOV_IV000680 [Babesia bovis T2Bo]|eukprot:XP_001609234.1 hypothetical protein [Babesia bovis T2Bo]
MAQMEDILKDPDAIDACRHLLHCYNNDLGVDVLKEMPDIKTASASFLSQIAGKPAEQVTDTLENLNHAGLIVKALRHKAVLNNTSDIIQSVGEVNELMDNLDEVTESVAELRQSIDTRYGSSIILYKELDDDIKKLERISAVQSYVIDCIEVLNSISALKLEIQNLGTSLSDFVSLLNTAHKLSEVLIEIDGMQHNDMRDFIYKHSNQLKSDIVNLTYDGGIGNLVKRAEASGSDQGLLNVITVCHLIFRELGVAPECSLRLVDEMVASTGRCIDMHQLMNADSCDNMWQQFFISQFAEFMAKYKKCLIALYTFCRSVNFRVSEHLEKNEQHLLTDCPTLSQTTHFVHNPFELYAACELYAKRSLGIIQTVLNHLESQSSSSDLSDVVMLAPQLITMGECTHADLKHVKIHFNLHGHYFRAICEKYAKEFMTKAAECILPESKTAFLGCYRLLKQNDVNNMKELSPERELHVASSLVRTLPTNDNLAQMIYEFLDKSRCCDTLHQHVLQIANSAVHNILNGAKVASTNSGHRLMLSDGGSKIALRKPNDMQNVNIRLYQYLTSLVNILEPCMTRSSDQESQLFHTLQECKTVELIDHWADDVGETLWHTVSYISSGGCQEFGWFVHQVLTAAQHMVKICKFLRENYFNHLPTEGRMKIFKRLSTYAISAFVIYSITVWPLEEDDKMSLLGVMTDLEMELAEISNESLHKTESDYLLAFRRLLYLGDELFDMIKTTDFQSHACLWLPLDVIALHLVTRIVNDVDIPPALREEVMQLPLHKFMGEPNIHAMLSRFHTSMLKYKNGIANSSSLGKKLGEYLGKFKMLESVFGQRLEDTFAFLSSH